MKTSMDIWMTTIVLASAVILLPACRPKPAKQAPLTGPPCVEGLPTSSVSPSYARSASTRADSGNQDAKLDGISRTLRDELGEAICQGYKCDEVKASLTRTPKRTDQEVCARLEVNRQALEEIKAKPQRDLERGISSALDVLLKHAPGQTRFELSGVWDGGVPGSHRADYIATTLDAVFSSKSLELISPLERDDSVNMIRASLSAVPGRKDQLDLKLELRRNGGRLVHESEVITFPAMLSGLALDPERIREPLTVGDKGGVVLSLKGASPSGTLCEGAYANLVMSASERVFVRVFMLYGEGKARMIWPRSPEDDVALLPGESRDIGGIHAADVPVQAQRRFYVIASESKEGLGRFASDMDRCEVPELEAKSMFKGLSYPPTALDRAFATGYRVSDQEGCAGETSASQDVLEVRVLDICGE